MSWSVGSAGKAPEVAAEIAKQFAAWKCQEPEETVRLAAQKAIGEALAAQDQEREVRVSAFGSQSCSNWEAPEAQRKYRNSLSITVTPEN
jgi:hypothetical protein